MPAGTPTKYAVPGEQLKGRALNLYAHPQEFNALKLHLTTKAHFLAVVGDGADYAAFKDVLHCARQPVRIIC